MIVYFNPIVMQWFEAKERPMINGLNAVAFNVGTGLILWLMADINALTGGWQASLTLFSIASFLVALVWLLVKFEQPATGDNAQEQSEQSYSYIEGLKDKFNWAYAFTYSGLLTFYICLFTFYPKAGISQSAWVIGFGIIGTFAGMIYSKKVLQRLPVIRWSGLIMSISLFALSFSQDTLIQSLAAIVLGFFIFFPITALVSIPHELPNMTSARVTVVFSLFYSISYLAATLVLWLFGRLVDINNGDYSMSLFMVSVLSLTFFIGSYFLPETNPVQSKLQTEEKTA